MFPVDSLDLGNVRLVVLQKHLCRREKWNDMFLSLNTEALQVFTLPYCLC